MMALGDRAYHGVVGACLDDGVAGVVPPKLRRELMEPTPPLFRMNELFNERKINNPAESNAFQHLRLLYGETHLITERTP